MTEGWILKKVKGKQEWMRKRKESNIYWAVTTRTTHTSHCFVLKVILMGDSLFLHLRELSPRGAWPRNPVFISCVSWALRILNTLLRSPWPRLRNLCPLCCDPRRSPGPTLQCLTKLIKAMSLRSHEWASNQKGRENSYLRVIPYVIEKQAKVPQKHIRSSLRGSKMLWHHWVKGWLSVCPG